MSVFDDLKKEVTGLEKKKGVLLEYKNNIQEEIKQLKIEEKSLVGEIEQLEDDLKNRKGNADKGKLKAEEERDAIVSDIQVKKEALVALKEELEKVAFEIFKVEEEAEDKLKKNSASISKVRGELKALRGEKAEVKAEVDSAKNELADIKEKISRIDSDLNQKEIDMEKLKNNRENLLEDISILEEKIVDLDKDFDISKAEAEKGLDDIKAEVFAKTSELSSIAKEIEDLAGEKSKIQEGIETNQSRAKFLSDWENELKVTAKAQSNRNADLKRRERTLADAEASISDNGGE